MERIKPNWELSEAISSARKTLKALEKYGKELEPRLPAGAVDGLKADLAVMAESKVSRPAYRKTALAKTKSERTLAKEGADILSRLRYSIKVCPASTPEVLKAVGVGSQVNPGKTTSVAESLKAMVEASKVYVDIFRAAGILPDDLNEARDFMTSLLGADEAQQETQYTKKELTELKNAAQKRAEETISAVAAAGQVQFRKQPAKRAIFEKLVPKTVKKKGKPAEKPKEEKK